MELTAEVGSPVGQNQMEDTVADMKEVVVMETDTAEAVVVTEVDRDKSVGVKDRVEVEVHIEVVETTTTVAAMRALEELPMVAENIGAPVVVVEEEVRFLVSNKELPAAEKPVAEGNDISESDQMDCPLKDV
ncbi:uncharacterized protein LOC129298593 [Prosopis cineraria]|uniref:uncharacterized protein LOC129298593 n=1 Tax=Prosopis cineraria TaxID=364024 RepID=UPI0024103DA1|nr:uncharacterized protein LOC129298593 [Prosopis cineraria]XP_054792991.1 uncharacterized protein LOC129298593 [Prosopis cineraria]XP_054792992.1 uncharacterized protein LOC129298593 [Prosopis cineraria]XP_054792993.1 uncharacterized protein LOC129298593 [Prosopis cineraria]